MDAIEMLMSWGAACGLMTLMGVTLLERLIPVLPSQAVLVAIGFGAAGGAWSVPTAIAATTAGSLLGCLAFYMLTMALGEPRSTVLVRNVGRIFGVSQARFEALTGYFRDHQRALAFGSQLVPTVRLIAPAIAGLLRADARTFIFATAGGVALWNGLFIGLGYGVSQLAPGTDPVCLVAQFVVALVAAEGLAASIWYARRRMRRNGRS